MTSRSSDYDYRLEQITGQIAEINLQMKSITETVDKINRVLLNFGFDNFHLECNQDQKTYKISRHGSGDIDGMYLSEGEKILLHIYISTLTRKKKSRTTTQYVLLLMIP